MQAGDLRDLGGIEAVAEVEVEHLAVALSERVRRVPHERDERGVLGEAGGVGECGEPVLRTGLRALDHCEAFFVDRL